MLNALEIDAREQTSRSFSPNYRLISEIPPDHLVPWLDRQVVDTAKLNSAPAPSLLSAWCEQGVLILENFIPKGVREPYFSVRQAFGRGDCQSHSTRSRKPVSTVEVT